MSRAKELIASCAPTARGSSHPRRGLARHKARLPVGAQRSTTKIPPHTVAGEFLPLDHRSWWRRRRALSRSRAPFPSLRSVTAPPSGAMLRRGPARGGGCGLPTTSTTSQHHLPATTGSGHHARPPASASTPPVTPKLRGVPLLQNPPDAGRLSVLFDQQLGHRLGAFGGLGIACGSANDRSFHQDVPGARERLGGAQAGFLGQLRDDRADVPEVLDAGPAGRGGRRPARAVR